MRTLPYDNGARGWAAAVVAALHLLALVALLAPMTLKNPNAAPERKMLVITLKPEQPAQNPFPAAIRVPMTSWPPATIPFVPQFSIARPDARPNDPITVFPDATSPSNVPGTTDYSDLFAADQKERFKRFFQQQAREDRQENAKVVRGKSACDMFSKPDDLGEAGELPSNGITKNFKPAFGIGIGGSEGDHAPMRTCN